MFGAFLGYSIIDLLFPPRIKNPKSPDMKDE